MSDVQEVDRHPPADTRCQIYIKESDAPLAQLDRCVNEGTHWVRWGGCGCTEEDPEICEGEYFSWECAGPCTPVSEVAA